MNAPADRRELILRHVDLSRPGLEIGPLDKPLVDRQVVPVLYVDHAGTRDLEAKYADDPNVGAIVNVDVVWDGDLRQSLGDRAPVHWVVGSHVLEHAPDLVGWLGQLAEVLVPGGVVSLAFPDKRFCFDAKRRVSDISEVVAATLERRHRPSVATVFDFWARFTAVDPVEAWEGKDYSSVPDKQLLALEKAREAAGSSSYTDIHCWVFTPATFSATLGRLFDLDLLPWYEVVELRSTEPYAIEFFVTLRRLADDLPADERRRRQTASLPDGPEVEDLVPASEAPARLLPVSDKEESLIQAKRLLMGGVRRIVSFVRARRGP